MADSQAKDRLGEGIGDFRVNGPGRIARLGLGAALAVAAGFLISGCSEIGFPAVHDMPAPRADTTLTPDQVQQATDNLISQRNRLSSETQNNGQPGATNSAPAPQKAIMTSTQPQATVQTAVGTTPATGTNTR